MSEQAARELEGVHNFRAVAPYPLAGGGHLRAGAIYRSGALELMTAADAAHLADEVGIATILDLRHPDEYGTIGQEHALAHRVVALSLFPEHTTQESVIAELNGLYGVGPSPLRYLHYLEIGGDRLARAFRLFADEESYPILVHCTAGKDRTGVLLGLVMDVAGVSADDIAHEYGLSDQSIGRLIAYLRSTGRQLQGTDEEIYARLSTPPDRMAGFMELVRQRFGSAEGYFRTAGIDDATLARVRALLRAG